METEIFIAPLQGWIVECASAEDAVAVKDADAILSNRDSFARSPAEIDRLITVLRRYGKESAAQMLAHLASRLRAALFLKHSVGYEAPKTVS